jgi:shikimate kinase
MKNIVLTGFMGTGKTTVSAELARLTGYACIEVDEEIEKRAGMPISEIFEREGEPRFREMETEMVREVSERKNTVISTGGGVVMREENMRALRSGGVVVCLTASPDAILERTGHNSDRPLLQVEDPMKKIMDLLEQRQPYYDKCDLMVDTEGKGPLEVAEEILRGIGWKS